MVQPPSESRNNRIDDLNFRTQNDWRLAEGDVDCDGEVLTSNPKVFGINDLNFGTQNDFRFAIVSADDLEFGPILCTK